MFTFLLLVFMWVVVSAAYIESEVKKDNYKSAFKALVGCVLVVLSLVIVKFM